MMDFIVLTVSFTVAILLASVVGFMIMTNPKVMKFYMNYMFKRMNEVEHSLDEEQMKDL